MQVASGRGGVFLSSVIPLLSCCCWGADSCSGCQHDTIRALARAPPCATSSEGPAAFCPPGTWDGMSLAPPLARRGGMLPMARYSRAAIHSNLLSHAAILSVGSPTLALRHESVLSFRGLKGGSPSSSYFSVAKSKDRGISRAEVRDAVTILTRDHLAPPNKLPVAALHRNWRSFPSNRPRRRPSSGPRSSWTGLGVIPHHIPSSRTLHNVSASVLGYRLRPFPFSFRK